MTVSTSTASEQPVTLSGENSVYAWFRRTFKFSPQLVGAAIFFVLLFAWVWLISKPGAGDQRISFSIFVIILILAIGIFPLTYLAYRNNQEPTQKDRVKDDFRFLGLADEAELEDVVDKLFHNVYSPSQFYIFAGLVSLLTLVMGMVYLTYFESRLSVFGTGNLGPLIKPLMKSDEINMIFAAFLGAYIFAIQELIRRYNTFDLLPQVYSSIFVRMVIATSVVGVGTAIITVDGGNTGLAFVIAFLIGIFPQRGIDWLSERSNSIISTQQRPSSVRPLDTIIGISGWHKARLVEMGIDDAQNLATVDIRKLLLTTQFDTQAIVNWIDQAILYVKVGEKIDSLRSSQIMTFSEAHAVIRDAFELSVESGETETSRNEFIVGLLKMLGLADRTDLRRLLDSS